MGAPALAVPGRLLLTRRVKMAAVWLAETKLARVSRERSLVRKRGFRRARLSPCRPVSRSVVSFGFQRVSVPLRVT